MARPHYFGQYRKRAEVRDYERPTWDLIRLIERRIAAGEYVHCGIVTDPRSQPRAYDWRRDVYRKLPRRAPAAAVRLDPDDRDRRREHPAARFAQAGRVMVRALLSLMPLVTLGCGNARNGAFATPLRSLQVRTQGHFGAWVPKK